MSRHIGTPATRQSRGLDASGLVTVAMTPFAPPAASVAAAYPSVYAYVASKSVGSPLLPS